MLLGRLWQPAPWTAIPSGGRPPGPPRVRFPGRTGPFPAFTGPGFPWFRVFTGPGFPWFRVFTGPGSSWVRVFTGHGFCWLRACAKPVPAFTRPGSCWLRAGGGPLSAFAGSVLVFTGSVLTFAGHDSCRLRAPVGPGPVFTGPAPGGCAPASAWFRPSPALAPVSSAPRGPSPVFSGAGPLVPAGPGLGWVGFAESRFLETLGSGGGWVGGRSGWRPACAAIGPPVPGWPRARRLGLPRPSPKASGHSAAADVTWPQ
jgi:hypothetical protein